MEAAARERLGKLIEQTRVERGMTKADVQRKADCAPNTYRRIIDGQSVRPKSLMQVLTAVGVFERPQAPQVVDDIEETTGWRAAITRTPDGDSAAAPLWSKYREVLDFVAEASALGAPPDLVQRFSNLAVDLLQAAQASTDAAPPADAANPDEQGVR